MNIENRQNRCKRNNKGFVLPIMVAIIVLLALTGTGLLTLGQNARIQSIRSTADIRARAAADSGLMQALHLMNKKADNELVWDNDTLPVITGMDLQNCSATFSFTITGDPDSGFTIESTGKSVQAERKVYATTDFRSVFNFAISVKEGLALYPNSAVTGYSSTTGATNLPVQIGTCSIGEDSILIMNNATIAGDVLVGVGGDPDVVILNRGTIEGESYDMPKSSYFPTIAPPIDASYRGSITESVTIGPSDSGRYTDIDLGNSEVINVAGGEVVLYVTEDIEMANGAEITIKPGASLVIYIDGDFISKEGAGINNENGIPGNFNLYGTGQPGQIIDMKAKNEFYGAVYAPNASVGIKAGGDIYGSFVSNDFEMKSKGVVHYDTALADVGIDDIGVSFVINSWREE